VGRVGNLLCGRATYVGQIFRRHDMAGDLKRQLPSHALRILDS
jgi:hypothetical protein